MALPPIQTDYAASSRNNPGKVAQRNDVLNSVTDAIANAKGIAGSIESGVTDLGYPAPQQRWDPNAVPVTAGHNDIYNPGAPLTPINPNGYRGYNPGQTVPGLMRGLSGGQTGIGVGQGYGGAAMPNTGGYAQAAGGQGTGIQKQLTAIQQALTGQGGMGV